MKTTTDETGTPELSAIPTFYAGTQFKSRLEAQAAALFDKLGWKWEYEKFSLMLPSGLTFIPDFYIESIALLVECRGYVSTRGRRQIDETVAVIEDERDALPLPDGNSAYEFLVIGPDKVALFKNSRRESIPATKRTACYLLPAAVYRCACGWTVLNDFLWCPNCNTHATAALLLSFCEGRILVNGAKVEDFCA